MRRITNTVDDDDDDDGFKKFFFSFLKTERFLFMFFRFAVGFFCLQTFALKWTRTMTTPTTRERGTGVPPRTRNTCPSIAWCSPTTPATWPPWWTNTFPGHWTMTRNSATPIKRRPKVRAAFSPIFRTTYYRVSTI